MNCISLPLSRPGINQITTGTNYAIQQTPSHLSISATANFTKLDQVLAQSNFYSWRLPDHPLTEPSLLRGR
jgi:hypothetical protein